MMAWKMMAWKTGSARDLARVATVTMAMTLMSSLGWAAFPPTDIHCGGDYQHHLQGVCTNEVDTLYWSFTTELVKTDPRGKVLRQIPVASHHGDLCFQAGKVFVAVNLGRFNDPAGNADSWVYVYDAASLDLLARHPTQEVFHGAGGIGVRDGRFYVVGGLPNGVAENYVYEYDADFTFSKKHVIESGWTELGIQTATYHDGAWWFGCYGKPQILLQTDAQFQMQGRYEFDCALGIVGVARDQFLVARGPRNERGRCHGVLHRAHPDATSGLLLAPTRTPATDLDQVRRSGSWQESRFRFAQATSLQTSEQGAALAFTFVGSGVAVRLGGHNVPAYGPPNLGQLVVTIDGKAERVLQPRGRPREIVLARHLPVEKHTVRIEHQQDGTLGGCRIEALRSWSATRGEIRFHVSGDANAHLVDCRAILRRGDTVVRNTLVRNWMTGQCALSGLPVGDDYTLEIQAVGWQTIRTQRFPITADQAVNLPPIYLRRDPATIRQRFRFPRLNQPAIRQPGETFRARFLGFDTQIDEVKLTRHVGPALISRTLRFTEDQAAAYYYDREVIATLPDDMPPGLYDLTVRVTGGRRTGVCRSPRSVQVVKSYPTDPVFVTFGHLDTSAQYQAEYPQRLVSVINTLAPDMVLCSNACNPAYVAGALVGLEIPLVVNFGNHQFPGHEAWFGDPVGLIECGPHVSVLNFGYPWHTDQSKATALLASRPGTTIRVINAFESNAPLPLLDTHRVAMIHDAHGIGKKVRDLGATPTRRIGKSNSESFRMVRFRNNRVASCTYNGHATAPIPFPRDNTTPVRVAFRHANDGIAPRNTAMVTNQLAEPYPNCRVTFVVPAGHYETKGGRMESQIASDDGRLHVLNMRVDLPAAGVVTVAVTRVP